MYFKTILVALCAIILAGCNHNHEAENNTEEEEVKFQYTAYTIILNFSLKLILLLPGKHQIFCRTSQPCRILLLSRKVKSI